jgi:hypothetical protein
VAITITGPRYLVQHLSDTEFHGQSYDISEGGACFVTNIPLPEHASICLQFLTHRISYEEGQVGESIDFFGSIVYVEKLIDGRFRIGMSFDEANQDIETKFFDVICSPDDQIPTIIYHT